MMQHRPRQPDNDLRDRAQERLEELGVDGVAAAPAEPLTIDSQAHRLLHELQVHQVELELQNEQLQASRAWVEAALASYTELYDFAPVPLMTLDRNGIIVEANLAAAQLLGIARVLLIDKRIDSFIPEPERRRFSAFLKRLFSERVHLACELMLSAKDGNICTVLIEASIAANINSCRMSLYDISERSVRERKLTSLARVFTHASEGMLITDPSGIITDVNPAAASITGFAVDALIGRSATMLRAEQQRPELYAAISTDLATKGAWSGQVHNRREDGTQYLVNENISALFDTDGTLLNYVSRFSLVPESPDAPWLPLAAPLPH
ncbi:MAG: PAS domain-containing protein [Massilia sp.]